MNANTSFFCGDCPPADRPLFPHINDLKEHYRNLHHTLTIFRCARCGDQFLHKTSLMRHVPTCVASGGIPPEELMDVEVFGCQDDVSPAPSQQPASPLQSQIIRPTEMVDLSSIAADVLLELRSKSTLTGKAIERFEDGCMKLLHQQNNLVSKLEGLLLQKSMPDVEIREILTEIGPVPNVFKGMKTIEEQMKLFSEKYGVVPPEEFYLGPRIDKRLDPTTNCFVQTQVNTSFQYISIIDTLKTVLSNKEIRKSIFEHVPSEDGILRSCVDGYHCKNHTFLAKHKNVIQLLLFYDDLEITNALGSKTSIHKLGVLFFQILNRPAHVSSQLSSIYLLALAYSEDLKLRGAYENLMTPFVQDMKKLTSDTGAEIMLDGSKFPLRAVLVAVTADTLAAHELLGFLGPSANYFCRQCMVKRQDFRKDGNVMGEPRTMDTHDEQVEEVLQNGRLSSQYGVKKKCPLNDIPFYHCVDGTVFDSFHDILEGTAPLDVKLVLRYFVYKRKALSVTALNERIESFSYGIPDRKNKPSANFTREMLVTKKKLKQSGSQMWCLMRVLPLILCDRLECTAEDDQHMEIIFLMQDIMKIVFAFELSLADTDRLDTLVFKHNELFKTLFVENPVEVQSEEEHDNDIEEENDGDIVAEEETAAKKLDVNFINKDHHMKHHGEMIRKWGPTVLMWCAKFEGRLKLFRQHAAIVCNFKNSPKTMATMFQLSKVTTENSETPEIQFQKGQSFSPALYPDLFQTLNLGNIELVSTNSATFRGEEYRPGLFVTIPSSDYRLKFAIIENIYVQENVCLLCVKSWKAQCLNAKYNCYNVVPHDASNSQVVSVHSLVNYRAIAPWVVSEDDSIYLSPRTVIV